MALYASGVAIPQDLTNALQGIGQSGQSGINANYNTLKQRQLQEGATLGRQPGSNSYGPQRMGIQQGLDTGNLEAALGGQVGNTAYQDTLAQREYGQQRQLAEEAARLNKPSLLEEILSGIGGAGKTAATYYGMKGAGGGRSPAAPQVASYAPPSYYDFG